jgi:hypothetical protein
MICVTVRRTLAYCVGIIYQIGEMSFADMEGAA